VRLYNMKHVDRELLDTILDEKEKGAIRAFYDNTYTRDVVRKVLLASVYYNGQMEKGEKPDPKRNFLLQAIESKSFENIGHVIYAKVQAVELLEEGFEALGSYQNDEEPRSEKYNPAI
jgi:predicted nucleic acid-binding protein